MRSIPYLHSLVIVLNGVQGVKDLGWDARLAEARHALEAAVGSDWHDACGADGATNSGYKKAMQDVM